MIGIDEVGRGAWAGPLVLAGVLFTENPSYIYELNDSKKLSLAKREYLAGKIKSSACFSLASVNPVEIDQLGLTLATKKCILKILNQLPMSRPIIIDGKHNFLVGTKWESKVFNAAKADSKYPQVMAASILAKVSRDEWMIKLAMKYPEYGFETNVGYGTLAHRKALARLGPIEGVHRFSYRPIQELVI